ncbi:MAG: hypothetical protein M3N41_11330 [Acidobacteriota bacterium]|nr:hypothetical protein [Acidobacteriota bacterium]
MSSPARPNKTPDQVKFDFIKSNYFRSAHADGVWGGVTGHLDIAMAFYSERPAIPQQIVIPIENGNFGNELEDKRVGRDAVIREVEISVTMNVEVARLFRQWLDEKIQAVDEINAKAKPKGSEKK